LKRINQQLVLVILLSFVGIILFALLTWANYRYAENSPGGNDFLVHWMGTRSLLVEGLDPYSDEVAERIQTMAYGRPAQAGEHELRVAFPLYSVIVFFPFALVGNFTIARALWMSVLEIGLVAVCLLSLRLARWKVHPFSLVILLIFTLLWYHGLYPLINGNAVVLVAVFIAGGLLALRAGADELAGVLFAFSTIKPQLVVLLLVFMTVWAISTHRLKVIAWMAGTVFLLSASAALLIPGWIVENLREVIRYPSYNPPGTIQAAFKVWWPAWGNRVGLAMTAVLAILLLVEWGNNRHGDERAFYWTACLTLVISQWIGIQTDPGNFIVLLMPLFLVFSLLDERWRNGGRAVVVICFIGLFIGIWALFLNTVQIANQPVQSPVMFLPLPAFLFLGLYWVRWWAVQPPRVWFDLVDR
jgi:hypothetical protein